MTDQSNLRCKAFADKIMSADEAAAFIPAGANVGMSGFTGSGYPKVVPAALVARMSEAKAQGDRFAVSVWTGASTAPELDGALAEVEGVDLRMPYQSDPVSRAKINAGLMEYMDIHLSHVAQMVWEGFFGHMDVAVIEVAGITATGELIPSTSVGNNKTWIDQADKIILEVNSAQPIELEGMHDIYYGTALPPDRLPLQIITPSDRIGVPYLHCPPEKIIAVVPTNSSDRNSPFKSPDADSKQIAGHVMDFLAHEVRPPRAGRSRASFRWPATSTTPSTIRMSSSPSRAWLTCAGCRRAAVPSRSSTTVPTPTTGQRCRTTWTEPRPAQASTHRTCSARHCRGTRATCRAAQCSRSDS
jgi:succinyl-CoA:acetate CoA-transferase